MAGWSVHQTPGQQAAGTWNPAAAMSHQHQQPLHHEALHQQPLHQQPLHQQPLHQQSAASNKRRSLHADPDESAHALKRLRIANPLTDPTFAAAGAAWPDPAAGVGLHLHHAQEYHAHMQQQQQHQQQQQMASASSDPNSASFHEYSAMNGMLAQLHAERIAAGARKPTRRQRPLICTT